MAIQLISAGTIFAASIVTILLYNIFLSLYRLFFHPLAKFPGPRLAAATGWYEFYHDIVHRGQFIWHIEQLHDQYGMSILIMNGLNDEILTDTFQAQLCASLQTSCIFGIPIITKMSMQQQQRSATNGQDG